MLSSFLDYDIVLQKITYYKMLMSKLRAKIITEMRVAEEAHRAAQIVAEQEEVPEETPEDMEEAEMKFQHAQATEAATRFEAKRAAILD